MLNQEKTPKHPDVMEDYTDGDQFKSCELSSLSNVRLHFYIDEFEIVNPLGSKRGKHKLTIRNIHQNLRIFTFHH